LLIYIHYILIIEGTNCGDSNYMIYDIVIVGAGPAGSTAAKILAEQGLSVILIDKEKFPRTKPCGGGLPLRTLKRFPYIEDIDVIESYSYGGYLYPPSLSYNIKIQKQDPVIAMILRKKFDNALVKLAIDQGVIFQDGKSVTDLKITHDKAQITLDDGKKIQTNLVIGADGCLSIVAKKARLATRNKFTGISVVEEFSLKMDTMDQFYTDKRLCHIHSKIHGISGYGWVFPKGHHVNIGLVKYRPNGNMVKEKKNIREMFNEYLFLLKKTDIIPKNIESTKLRGGILPVKPLEKTYANRIILCGDAAGFINPVSGEGIYYALASGEIAARVASESIKTNDNSEQFLSRYEQQWKNDFGQEINIWLKSTRQWGKQNENIFKFMSKDNKLAEMFFAIMTGQESVYELRWKIIKRYIYAYMKYSLLRKRKMI